MNGWWGQSRREEQKISVWHFLPGETFLQVARLLRLRRNLNYGHVSSVLHLALLIADQIHSHLNSKRRSSGCSNLVIVTHKGLGLLDGVQLGCRLLSLPAFFTHTCICLLCACKQLSISAVKYMERNKWPDLVFVIASLPLKTVGEICIKYKQSTTPTSHLCYV